MSSRNRRSRWNQYSQQPSASGYFNPEALEASTSLVTTSLETVCKNTDTMKNLIENEQTQQAIQFFHQVFMPQVNAIRKQLTHTAYLEKQKVQNGIEASGGSGSSRSSVTHLPSARALVQELKNDPRKLREYQEEISRAAAAS